MEDNYKEVKKEEPCLKLIHMDQVEVEEIEWLFYPFIPYGKVTIIQGDPGEGKTTVVLQIIAKLTKGEIRVICHVKSSLAPEGDAIAFRLDKEKGFHWIGKYDISVEDLLSGDGRGQKIRSAKEFLKEILANGSMEQAKIAEEAEERGIKKKTLWNAKKELQIDSVKIGNKWFWMLQDE